jgi:hypothetical protein
MRNQKIEEQTQPATIDITKLADVTGGCAACGNPGGQCAFQRQQQAQAPAPTQRAQ